MHQSLLKPTVEGAATASRPTAGQACTPLSRHSAVTLAMAACTLVLLAAIVGPRQRGDCGSESALQVAQLTQAEPPDNATVAICSIMRLDPDDPQWVDGRAEDLLEWVEHHRSIGIGRIYIYDHLSPVPLNETLRDAIESGFVVYEYYLVPADGIINPMQLVFDACHARYGSQHRFIAFIDADEYLVIMDKRPNALTTIGGLLDEYHNIRPFGGLLVVWVSFGSSGHITRPPGGVLRNYWRCTPRASGQSLHVKTIVNTQHANKSKGSHSWLFNEPYYAIDEGFERFDHVVLPAPRGTVNRLALFHYVTKSHEDWEYKVRRGGGDGDHKQLAFINGTDAEAFCNCTDLAMPGAPVGCDDGDHPYIAPPR